MVRHRWHIIGVMMTAMILAGCGNQSKTAAPDGSAQVRPKDAQTEIQVMTESQTAREDQAAAESQKETEAQAAAPASSAEQNTEKTEQPAAERNTEKAAQPAQSEGGTAITTEDLITEDEAKAIALKDAGVDEADLSGVRIKLERDDGAYEYEVDFYVGNLEYDYDINASTGKIVSMDRDIDHDFQMTEQSSGQIISEDEAKKVAMAKVPQATEEDVRIHLDRDDGRQIYEGSIYLSGVEYEFEIDAATGVILEWEEDD